MIVSRAEHKNPNHQNHKEPLPEETLAYIRQLQQERDDAIHTLKVIQTCFESPELHERVQRCLARLSPPTTAHS